MTAAEEQESPAEIAVCPICFAELNANRQEVGALTFEGCRVEHALYHLGCITMMLCHKGSLSPKIASYEPSGRNRSASPPGRNRLASPTDRISSDEEERKAESEVQVTWGLSPMTRLKVDGFALVPPISDLEKWVEFANWKSAGYIDILDLAVLLSMSLPVTQSVAEVALKPFAGSDDRIAMSELRSNVLPDISKRLRELKAASKAKPTKPSHEPQQRPSTVVDFDALADHLGCLSDLCSLQAVSRPVRAVARLLLVREACLFLECRRAVACPDAARSSKCSTRKTVTAVRLLARNARIGDPRAIEAAVSLLDENEEIVLKVVPTLLPSLAARGDSHTIQAVASRLQHPSCAVRRAALEAMEQLAEKGDEQVIEAFVCRLGDSDSTVRWRAVRALLQTAEAGNQRALTSIYRCLVSPRVGGGSSQSQAEAKRALLKVMAKLAVKGDQQAIAAASAQILDSSFAVRVAAVSAFGQLAERGDDFVVETLLSSLNASDPHMRWAALAALARVSTPGDGRVVGAVCAQLEDEHSFIQQEALRTLGQLADIALPNVVKRVSHVAVSRDATTRWTAVQTLGALIAGVPIRPGVINTNHELALKALTDRLEDEDVLVRLDAARHLGHMTTPASARPSHLYYEETSSLSSFGCDVLPAACRCQGSSSSQDIGEWTAPPPPRYLQCLRPHPDMYRTHDEGVFHLPEPPTSSKWRTRVPWKVHL